MYIATDYARPVNINGTGDGLFQNSTISPAGRHIILTTDEHGRYAIFIDSSQARFHFYKIKSANLRASGLLYDAPRVEFDPTDSFDATKQHEALGDLIMTSGGAAIMAVSAASSRSPQRHLYDIVPPHAAAVVLWEKAVRIGR